MVNIKVKKQKGINKVKQKVNQKVNQKVIVNVGDLKPKRRRAPPRPKKTDEKPTQPTQQAMPRTFYQQPNVDNSNLVALLMKNLAGQQEVKPEKKPNELEKAKPKEEEKPAIELKALVGQKAEERRQANFDLGGTSLLQEIAPPKSTLSEFKAKFKNSRDDDERRKASASFSNQRFDEEAEQEQFDRFEKAKKLTALYRQVEAPVIELKQSSLADEVEADPKFKSVGVNTIRGKKTEFKYDNALELLLRNRAPEEQPQSEFDTPRLEPVRRFRIGGQKSLAEIASGKKEFAPAKNLSFQPAPPETFDKLGESQLTRPEEQGPSLAAAVAEEAVAELKEPSLFEEQPIIPIALPQTGEPGFVFNEGQEIAPLNLSEAQTQAPPEAPVEPYFGSELLPPVQEQSTILNQPPAPSTTQQLFNPVREPSLAEIVEPKVKKAPSDKQLTLQRLAIEAGIPINGTYIDENGEQKKSGKVPNYVLARELRAKGVPKDIVPDDWLVKSKAGKPHKGPE